MNKKIIVFISVILIIIALFFGLESLSDKEGESSSALGSTQPVSVEPQKENSSSLVSQETILADKIEVVHFHATRQCWSCITVGEYALQTIKDKFPEEYQSGKIVFKDINIELLENKELVTKYQAGGSSLFVNVISNNIDNIKEDTAVWQLVNDQEKFTDYFENKLKTFLGN
ncbi:nitrophenyl compound nitroreductase subunit ArsF family protein [Patescibacteria group bacterium]|nr:nitrophenyl compound nitroreductase subunit ArsF family protein [Patescibacteria group bacterium]